MEKTLEALQLDYVDLYIIELPMAFKVCIAPVCTRKAGMLTYLPASKFTDVYLAGSPRRQSDKGITLMLLVTQW